jgi:hypothetical protein
MAVDDITGGELLTRCLGLYKATDAVAAVIGNLGPGSANLLAGVLTARHEGVSMGRAEEGPLVKLLEAYQGPIP